MFVVIAFVWRKRGISPAQFQSHYEDVHMQLLKDLFGKDFPRSHTRYYVTRESQYASTASSTSTNFVPNVIVGTVEDFDYDAIVPIVFENREAFQSFYDRMMRDPAVVPRLNADEEKFVERKQLKVVGTSEAFITAKDGQ
ncbi:MAG: hypothetical protein Q9159_001186 [Coniocarpon cinnabarinum]